MSERVAHPLGLVVKRSVWYLLADTDAGQRSFRVDRVVGVDPYEAPAVRPADFDLEAAWDAITADYEQQFRRVSVRAVIEPWTVAALRSLGVEVGLEPIVEPGGPPGSRPDGRLDATLGGMSVDVLAAELAGVMHGVELVDAPEVETRLAEIGAHLVSRFREPLDR